MSKDKFFHKRKAKVRNQNPVYLIIGVGKTEKLYFEGFRKHIKSIKVVCYEGKGKDPTSLAKFAIKKTKEFYNTHQTYPEKAFVIFDIDDYTQANFSSAEQIVNSFTQCEVSILASNQSIEVWFLLHFQQTIPQVQKHRRSEEYKALLETHLTRQYNKGQTDIFDLLQPKILNAIRNAEKMRTLRAGTNILVSEPSTDVDLLVKRLVQNL